MYGRMLDLDPGTVYHYSNFGYLLAGAVVEHVSGMKYFEYVKATLLQPAGITEVEGIPTLASQRTNDMAIVEDEGLGQIPLDLGSQLLVPAVYGGDAEINEVGDPNDGTGASAHALTQFIHLLAVWGNGPRPANGTFGRLARTGSTLALPRGPSPGATVSTGLLSSTRATGRHVLHPRRPTIWATRLRSSSIRRRSHDRHPSCPALCPVKGAAKNCRQKV
jgi:CubicO group peptidase (beta-lactamase class C family)